MWLGGCGCVCVCDVGWVCVYVCGMQLSVCVVCGTWLCVCVRAMWGCVWHVTGCVSVCVARVAV